MRDGEEGGSESMVRHRVEPFSEHPELFSAWQLRPEFPTKCACRRIACRPVRFAVSADCRVAQEFLKKTAGSVRTATLGLFAAGSDGSLGFLRESLESVPVEPEMRSQARLRGVPLSLCFRIIGLRRFRH